MAKSQYLHKVITELDKLAEHVDDSQLQDAVELIAGCKRIFVTGVGRTGAVMRAFANRLMHLGLSVYFVGDYTTPAIHKKDLLIVGTGSGETGSLVTMTNKASALEARILVLTIQSESTIGQKADRIVNIPGVSPKTDNDRIYESMQPMGNAFEQLTWLVCDTLIAYLMIRLDKTDTEMYALHANLE